MPAKRNPFNEIECSDHYGRAMASYGTFISACGFDYNGPEGYIRFAPKWSADHFKAPFTAAEGWGTYSQQKSANGQEHTIMVKAGSLQLRSICLDKMDDQPVKGADVLIAKQKIPARFTLQDEQITIQLASFSRIQAGEDLQIIIRS